MTTVTETLPVLDIHPVAGRIGAEIRGVTLSGDIDGAVLAALRQALLRHKVIFLRGQGHLTDQEQERFAQRLGTPVAHPTVPAVPGTATLLELDSKHGARANSWHTDVTFIDAYPQASILRAVVIPAAGGDTVWANTASAYLDLPPELRELADRLWAIHTNLYDYAAARPDLSEDARKAFQSVFASTVYETEHPVVHIHPETGERNLLLGHFVKRFKGYSDAQSQSLFQLLQGHVTRLENTVRWRWTVGDVAIWDNRQTQHYAIDDYGTQDRVVRRATLSGTVPVSLDGRRSVTRVNGDIIRQPAAAE